MIWNWSTQPILNSHLLVMVLATVLSLLLLIRPAFRQLSLPRQRLLQGLRLGVVLLMLLAMLRPTLVRSIGERQRAVLVMLFDQSRSMQLSSDRQGETRWESMVRVLDRCRVSLAGLRKEVDVRGYVFDKQLIATEWGEAGFALPLNPEGDQTDIGSSLFDAVRREAGRKVVGVILMGDGAQNAFAPGVELVEAGREMQRLEFPLYGVPLGPAGGDGQTRDVAIEGLPEQYTVFVKTELRVTARLRVRGYVNLQIPVEMILEDSAGNQKPIGRQELSVTEDGQYVEIDMPFIPEKPGKYRVILDAQSQAGEVVTSNNQSTSYVTVLEGGLQVVIYVGGFRQGSPEMRIRDSLASSPDMQVRLVDLRGYNFPENWPLKTNGTTADPTVDVYLIGSVYADALGDTALQNLETAVSAGKGLMMIGGPHSFGPGNYRDSSLSDVLPITIGPLEKEDFNGPPRRDVHLRNRGDDPNDLRMIPVRPHPVTSLSTPSQNAAAWKRLPELDWANRFAEVKDTPGTQVLLETIGKNPILVSGEYGRGRVLAFAGDSTWKWLSRPGTSSFESEHKRFWRQAILWLARRDELQKDDVWIQLDQRRFFPTSPIKFSGGAKDSAGETIADAVFQAKLIAPSGSASMISLSAADREVAGTISGIDQPGNYQIQLIGMRQNQKLGETTAAFQILDRDIELSNPAADPAQLARLTRMTRAAGGRLVAPEQLPELLKEIRENPQEREIRAQARWQLADTLWDAWLFFLGVALLLSLEWGLRKKWGLV